MSLAKITSHESEGLALILEQFKDSDTLKNLIGSYLREVQEVEDALWDVFSMTLANAEGDQLDDVYGALVGVERNGKTDDQYRISIGAQIAINRSSGTIDDLLNIANLITAGGTVLTLTEHYPKAMEVQASGVANDSEASTIASRLRAAKDAGARLIFIYQADVDANVFTWDSTTSTQEWDGGEMAAAIDGA